ncbi:MAG TPA: SDR family NAD(P)-dependent oxidoreductase [Myxococcota bacterium]|nr:SDR family NAD(P)-dependent oxidoreductase [Myxococcota bacterium]
MAGRLAGKVALISGTGAGQGRCAALAFAREGARVVGCDLDAAGARETVALVRAGGGEMVSLEPVDLVQEAEVERWIRFAVEHFGDFDILYNNAAVARTGLLEELRRADWDWNLEHELTLVFLAVKHAVPVFRRRGGGAIVNVGSIAGMVGSGMPGNAPGNLVHCVAKAAVIRLTEALAIELSPLGVRVNCVSPGVIDTPQLRPFLGDDPGSPLRRLVESNCLVPRVGQVEDVVNAALFLASDEASYVTGANLPVDGGFSASGGVGRPRADHASAVDAAMVRFDAPAAAPAGARR